jgi:hypothetical protein
VPCFSYLPCSFWCWSRWPCAPGSGRPVAIVASAGAKRPCPFAPRSGADGGPRDLPDVKNYAATHKGTRKHTNNTQAHTYVYDIMFMYMHTHTHICVYI